MPLGVITEAQRNVPDRSGSDAFRCSLSLNPRHGKARHRDAGAANPLFLYCRHIYVNPSFLSCVLHVETHTAACYLHVHSLFVLLQSLIRVLMGLVPFCLCFGKGHTGYFPWHNILFHHCQNPSVKPRGQTGMGFVSRVPPAFVKGQFQLDQRSDIFKMSLCGSNGTDLNNRCRGAMNVAVKY